MHVDAFYASTDTEIEAAFAAMTQNHAQTLLVAPDEFFTTRMEKLATLSLRHQFPSSYAISEFAKAGGLMSYGPDFVNAYRETGVYTGRVLKGEKPANLPVEQPTKFQFVINLKTAKTLGLTVPPTLLATADEVIE
jgi:putative tryptophan/tyrosine transport system substrate-binding protein